MKRFDFRLKSVLILRQRLLNEAEQRYSHAIASRRAVEGKIEAHLQNLERMNEQMMAEQKQSFRGATQQGFLMFMGDAQQHLKALEQELRVATQHELKARSHYLEANRNHELLLKLKNRQRTEHLQRELLKEQQLQDDMFNARRALSTGVTRA